MLSDQEILELVYGKGININNEVTVYLTDIYNTPFGMSTSLKSINSISSSADNDMENFNSSRKVLILNFITSDLKRKQAYIKIFQMKTLSEAIECNSFIYIIIEPYFDIIIFDLIMDLYKGKVNLEKGSVYSLI